MMDYRLALMAGIDIPIPECQLTLHQPRIKEIAYVGEKDFFTGVQCLCLEKSMLIQDERVLATTTNFQIFMTVMSEKETMDKKQNVLSVLTILFPQYRVLFTPRALVFSAEGADPITVDATNFDALQHMISEIFCLSKTDESTFNPANKKAREIADKLMKARKRVAELKSAQGENGSVLAQYLSSLTVGIGSMSLNDCLDLTLYQMYDLVERYSLFINWDIDLRSRLAGATADKPMDNWMKNIH